MLTSRTSIWLPGTFDPNRRVMPSSGWTRITNAFLPSSSVIVVSNGRCGARLNSSAISVTLRPNRLPVRRKNGTPAHRRVSISRAMAAYVSVLESFEKPSSSSRPGTFSLPCQPAAY